MARAQPHALPPAPPRIRSLTSCPGGGIRITLGRGSSSPSFTVESAGGARQRFRTAVPREHRKSLPGTIPAPLLLLLLPLLLPLLLLLLLLLLEPHRARIHSPQWLMTSTPRVSCQKPGGKAWPLPSSQFPRTCQCLPLLQCNRRATGKGIWGNSFRSCSPQSGEEYGEGQG